METKQKIKKPFIHVDILAELAKERQETLDKLLVKETPGIEGRIAAALGRSPYTTGQIESVESRIKAGATFTTDEIKKIANKYALRFAPAAKYKGKYPESAIQALKEKTGAWMTTPTVKILAPLKAFNFTITDPVMFVQNGTDWEVVAKWGNDFTVFRRLLSRDFKPLHISVGILTMLVFLGLAIGIWWSPQAWYWCLGEMLLFLVALVFGVCFTGTATQDNPEPLFYDPKQWDRVDIKTE